MNEERSLLEGVRVVDFTHILAGPFCTQLLADAGATVIKVEPPGGEWARRRGHKRTAHDGRQVSSYFAAVNRGKKSIVLDLKVEAGRKVAERLIAQADVVVENFLPGTMERLGLPLTEFRARNPRLITASISLFGGRESAGAFADRGGLAVAAEAESTIMSQHLGSDGRPISTPYGLGDMASGLAAYAAVLTALFDRVGSGRGRHLDIAMTRVLLSFNAIKITAEEINRDGPTDPSESRTAAMGIFSASDGYVTIGVNSDVLFARLAAAMDRSDLAADPIFANYATRDSRADEINKLVDAWTRQRTVDEVIAALSANAVPCGRVSTPRDILASAAAAQLNLFETVEDGLGGSLRSPANPLGFRNGRSSIPEAGADTREVIAELCPGQSDAYTALRKEGAFGIG